MHNFFYGLSKDSHSTARFSRLAKWKLGAALVFSLMLALPLTALAAPVITEYPVTGISPYKIAAGPDGNLWFTGAANTIGKISTTGTATQYTVPTASAYTNGITAGPDGNVWFV